MPSLKIKSLFVKRLFVLFRNFCKHYWYEVIEMNDNKRKLKKKLSDVPNPPVPNRAHTEMKAENKCNEEKTTNQKKKSNR